MAYYGIISLSDFRKKERNINSTRKNVKQTDS